MRGGIVIVYICIYVCIIFIPGFLGDWFIFKLVLKQGLVRSQADLHLTV